LGEGRGKSEEQCKVKAQYLKKKWYTDRTNKLDLIDVSLTSLKAWLGVQGKQANSRLSSETS
jgi:hypothetical protein